MIIFDFDMTLADTQPFEKLRKALNWRAVMARISEIEAYEGIRETLFDLRKRNHELAIVTKGQNMIPLKFIELQKWPIDIVIGYHQVKRQKPYPDGLLLAMNKANASDEKTFHVGDSPEDTQASCAANVIAIGAGWGISDTRDLAASAPDHLFLTVSEMRDFFDNLA